MRKRRLLTLFVCFLALAVRAAHFSEGFEDITLTDQQGNPLSSSYSFGYGLSNGWRIVGGTIYASPGVTNYGLSSKAHTGNKALEASYSSTNAAFIVIPTPLTGDFTFWVCRTSARSAGKVSLLEVEPDGDSYTSKEVIETVSPASTSWEQHTINLGTGQRLIAIQMSRSAIDDVEYDSYEVPASPLMELRMNDKKVSNLSFDLGLTVKDSLLSFTLANVGAGTLEASLSATGGYEVSPATLCVEGGQVQPFSVRQPADIPGALSGTVTITAPDLEPISVSLRGIVRDPDKIYLNFDSLPQGWTLNEYGSLADSSLIASSWNDAVLTSPAVEVAEGEDLFFRYTRTSDASYQKPTVTVAYSDDDGNWTEMETNFADDAVYQQWGYAHISGIPTSARRIRLTMRYVVIDDLYGFSLPQKAIMQVTAADQDFGMIAADSARFFIVRNEGTAPLNDLKAVSSDPHFSVSLPESIAPGDSAMASLTLAAGESGLFSTLITVSATNQDTVSFRAEGYVVNQDALWLPLRDSLPDGWKNQGWELSDDGAHADYGGQETRSIISPRLLIDSNDSLVFRAAREYESGWIRFYLSSDRGATWQMLKEYGSQLSDTARTFSLKDVPAGDYMLRIDGNYAFLYGLNGFHLNDHAPSLTLTQNGLPVSDGFVDDFGILYHPVEHVYEVTNTGTGILSLHVSASQEHLFALSDTVFNLKADSTTTLTVVPVFDDNFGARQTIITFAPEGEQMLPIAVTASVVTRDSTKFHEDFENGFSPLWSNVGWEIETPFYGNGTRMASATNTDSTCLVTPRLRALKGDSLLFEAMLPWTDEPLTVEYSYDEQATWNTASVYNADDNNAYLCLKFTAPEDGCFFLRFVSKYGYLDNFYGFTYEPNAPQPNGLLHTATRINDSTVVYDLAGRKLNPHALTPGLYIRDGKKFIKK